MFFFFQSFEFERENGRNKGSGSGVKLRTRKHGCFASVFLILFIFSPFAYGYVSITHEFKRTDYPGQAISKRVQEEWNKNYSNEIIAVIGDEWHAGNLSYHLKTRPKWFPRSVTDIRSPDYGKQFNHQFKNLDQGWVAVVAFGYECRGVSFDLPFFRLCMIDKI